MWALAAMFGLNLLKGQQAKKQIKANNKAAVQNAAIQDQLTQANNTVAAASGALSRFRQSLGNQLILKNAAKQTDALAKNLIRQQEQSQTQGLNTKLQAAEATGALMAAASAAGIAGGTINQLNSVIRGRAARQEEQRQRAGRYAAQDTFDRIRTVNENAISSLDDTVFLDRVTQVKAVPNQQAVPSTLSLVGNAALSTLGSQAGIDAVSQLGTFFKSTPASGAALQVGGFNPVTLSVEDPTFGAPASWFRS